jgi:hypothetical protein
MPKVPRPRRPRVDAAAEEARWEVPGLACSARPSTVWAECLFADPIADVAVLGSPDNQALYDEADAYEELLKNTVPLLIAEALTMVRERVPGFRGRSFEVDTPGRGSARVLSLAGEWMDYTVTAWRKWLSIDQGELVAGGMSGSPILHWMAAQSASCRPVDRIRSSKRTSRRGSFADHGGRPGGKRPHR